MSEQSKPAPRRSRAKKRTLVQVMSYGGGVQSAAMVALVLQGKLQRPDRMVIADTGREKRTTWKYLDEVIQPALREIGMEVERVDHSYAKRDLYSGNGDLLIPVYTDTGGKLPTFCSSEWKERAIQRYLKESGVNLCLCWIGYSVDEEERAKRRQDRLKWYRRHYPLLSLGLNRADCKMIVERMGWPVPPKSSCWMCPNQDDESWLDLKLNNPEDFQRAVELERELQDEFERPLWLHDSLGPIDQAKFNPGKGRRKRIGAYQCSIGCFI